MKKTTNASESDTARRSKALRHRRAWVHRGVAARRLLAAHHFHDSLRLVRPVSPYMATIAGVQAGLAVLVALVLIRYSLWPDLVGFGALGALAALFGRFAPLMQRHGVVLVCASMLTGAVFTTSLVSWAGVPEFVVVSFVAVIAAVSSFAFSYWKLGGPGAVIIVFAAGGAMTPVDSWAQVVERTLATMAGGGVAWLVTSATDFLRVPELARIHLPKEPSRPMRNILLSAGRIGLGAAAAALIAYAAGWNHPAWAAIGATAVMQGGHLHITMHRALQRMLGTLVGALLVWAILAAEPHFWSIVAMIVVFQFVTEVVIGYNYALGQITITPMALLMTYLAAPAAEAAGMSIERVFDTMLGAVLGIAFAVLFSTMDDRAHLARRHRERISDNGAD